jgi:ABC-type dipeptide/oligopeptide/nickel transport system permease subunit
MSAVTLPSRTLPFHGRLRISPAMRRPLAIVGAVVVAIWVLVAIFAPLLAPSAPLTLGDSLLQGPSAHHLFGTDELGRDVLTRVLYGARISLPVAALLVLLSLVIGGVLGGVAGYFGSWVDALIMRIVDLVFAFPAIVLALVITAVLGPSLQNAVLALVVVSWPTYARVVRGLVLAVGGSEFVQATRLLGASAPRALMRDVLPNVIGPVVVLVTLDFGNAILLLSALSFLGLGAQAPTPEWGSMVAEGTQYFQQWWIGTFPGIAIFTVVLALNFLGDSLRDALDPRSTWTSGGRRRAGSA